jgi:hypothetical protein
VGLSGLESDCDVVIKLAVDDLTEASSNM